MQSESKATKHEQMVNLAAMYRGLYLNDFVRIEHILADIIINIKYSGDYSAYYNKPKTALTIIKDFWEAIDNHENIVKINDRIEAEEMLNILGQIRNNLAHYLLDETDDKINEFDNNTIYLFSYHLSRLRAVVYNMETIWQARQYSDVVFARLVHLQHHINLLKKEQRKA